jgi:hypothetical protein
MPQTTVLSLDLGPGEKGRTEKQAPLSRKKMTFHFSTIMGTRGSSTLVSRSGAWTGGPKTYQYIKGGTSPSVWRQGNLDLQWLPLQQGQGPSGGPGMFHFWAFPVEVPLLSTW